MCRELPNSLYPDFSIINILPHLFYLSLSMYIDRQIDTNIYYHYSFLNHLSSNCRPNDSSLSLPPVSIFPKQRQSPTQPQYNQNQKTISIQLYHPVHRTLSSFSNYPNNVSFLLVQQPIQDHALNCNGFPISLNLESCFSLSICSVCRYSFT